MENVHSFKIYYGNVAVCTLVAHTKWEAIDKAFYKYIGVHPHIVRSKFKATKLF